MKHKHYDCIVGWANGKQIQLKQFDGDWEDIDNPNWIEGCQYRIKPEPKPTLFFGRAVYFADPRTGEILPPPDLSIEANQVAYDVAMHYANKTKEKLAKPEREWVGLTDKEMELLVIQAREVPIEIPCDSFTTRLLKLAEAKLKDKNTTNQ